MKKAIMVFFYNYTQTMGYEYFEVMYRYFLNSLNKSKDEFHKLYVVDGNNNFTQIQKDNLLKNIYYPVTFLNPDFDYWGKDSKKLLANVDEDILLITHQDMVFSKSKCLHDGFIKIEEGYDVVSIFDAIGDLREIINVKYPIMNGKSKFCLYYFMFRKSFLDQIPSFNFNPKIFPKGTFISELDYHVDNDKWVEALGEITIQVLGLNGKVYEMEEDKENMLLDGENIMITEKSKDLGYYHIRFGSSACFLLTHKYISKNGDYENYIKSQPKTEYLRQLAWYYIMCETLEESKIQGDIHGILEDVNVPLDKWQMYISRFKNFYHI